MSGVRLVTVKKWVADLDSLNEWLRYEETSGNVTRVFCDLCMKHADKLKSLRNFSPAFVNGISGSALKKDNVIKHLKSDMHARAVSLSHQPKSRDEIFRATPIGRAIAGASREEMARVSKLFDLAYVLAKEELPFSKYPALVEVEKRHGVATGNTYITEHKCQEFTCIIGESMRNELLASLKTAKYFSVLMDGSTDTSMTEKELIYVMHVNSFGKPVCHFFCLKDVLDATALGVKHTLEQAFTEVGISDLQEKMVCLCVL